MRTAITLFLVVLLCFFCGCKSKTGDGPNPDPVPDPPTHKIGVGYELDSSTGASPTELPPYEVLHLQVAETDGAGGVKEPLKDTYFAVKKKDGPSVFNLELEVDANSTAYWDPYLAYRPFNYPDGLYQIFAYSKDHELLAQAEITVLSDELDLEIPRFVVGGKKVKIKFHHRDQSNGELSAFDKGGKLYLFKLGKDGIVEKEIVISGSSQWEGELPVGKKYGRWYARFIHRVSEEPLVELKSAFVPIWVADPESADIGITWSNPHGPYFAVNSTVTLELLATVYTLGEKLVVTKKDSNDPPKEYGFVGGMVKWLVPNDPKSTYFFEVKGVDDSTLLPIHPTHDEEFRSIRAEAWIYEP